MNARASLLFPAICLVFATAAPAQDKWPVPRGDSREPAPFRYNPRVWDKVPRAFLDNAPACVLYSATSHLLETDGTVETTSHEITRLNGRKGIDNLGEYHHIVFDPRFQKLTLNLARIHKSGGKIVDIEPRHVQLRDVGTDYLVYDQDKHLVISFPNLEVGDVYEVKWTVRGKDLEFGDFFFSRYTFGDDRHPVVRDELHVVLPKDKPFKHAVVNGKINLKVKDKGALRHYHWSVKNRPELPRDEDRPSSEELRWQVACSTFPDWESVAKWKQQLRAKCWTCTPEIRKIVDEVAGKHQSPLDKARGLTYWVRRQIRYVSRGPGGLGYTPHPPHQVLTNLYGDCKDQAQLLAVMLREIGLSPYLVTLGTLDDGQVLPDVPSPWGTHAILLVKIDGKDHWIDTTVSQAPWDYLPRSDCGRQVYVTRDGELLLMRTPAFTWQNQRYEQTSEVVVRPDGSSVIQRQVAYHGGAGVSRRNAWLETPPGERRRLITQELQDAHSRSRLVALAIDDKNLLDFDRPVSARLEFHIARHFSGDDTLEGSLTDSNVWGRLLAYNLDSDRKLPLMLAGPFTSVHRYRVLLPMAYRFDNLPSSQTVKSRFGHFSLYVKLDEKNPRVLDLVMETRIENDRVLPNHFAEFQKFHEEVSKAYRVWLTLKPTRELADAPLLETLLTLAPGSDRLAAEVLARLYLDNDRTDDARRVLDANLFYHPRETSLWELRVKACATFAEEEQSYRAMVRLFPKEVQYQVALGTTLTKRRDHAAARLVLVPLVATTSGATRGKVHFQLAHGFFHERQHETALKHLEAARVADATVMGAAGSWQFLAEVQEKLGNHAKAIEAYQKGLASDPQSGDMLTALIRLRLGDPESKESLDLIRRFTLLARDPATLALAAEFHWQLGRLEDAFELASRAREKAFQGRAQRVLGLVHEKRGNFELAIFHLDRVDSDVHVLEALLRAHLALGQLHLAELRLALTEVSSPTLDKLRLTVKDLTQNREEILTKINLLADKKAAGRRAVDAFVCADHAWHQGVDSASVGKLLAGAFAENGVDLAPAFSLRGLVHLQQGCMTKARADADRALALSPVDSRAFLVRGRIRLVRGDKEALADLERAAKLSRHSDAQILHWFAAAQYQAGQRDQALATQRRAVKLKPNDEEYQAQLREWQ